MPYFGNLRSDDIHEKSPLDLVTAADYASEAMLTDALSRANPDALVLGEEAVSRNPSLMSAIDGSDHVWLLDPLDGTNNFVQAKPDFGIMVAELQSGLLLRSWIWRPMFRQMFVAERGAGATVNGVPIRIPSRSERLLVGGVSRDFLGLQDRRLARPLPMTGSCSSDYPLMATGERDYLIHNGRKPWDHYPGSLLLSEIGGMVQFPDGERFSAAPSSPYNLVAANTVDAWRTVAEAVLARGTVPAPLA